MDLDNSPEVVSEIWCDCDGWVDEIILTLQEGGGPDEAFSVVFWLQR